MPQEAWADWDAGYCTNGPSSGRSSGNPDMVVSGTPARSSSSAAFLTSSFSSSDQDQAVRKMRKLVPLYLHGFASAGRLRAQLLQARTLEEWVDCAGNGKRGAACVCSGACDMWSVGAERLKGGNCKDALSCTDTGQLGRTLVYRQV